MEFNKSVYIIEGFDIVGKSSFVKKEMSDYFYYHPTHDLTDNTVGRGYSWIMGYGIIDFLSQCNKPEDRYVIDRGVASSYVYERIYHNKNLDPKIVEWYKNNRYFTDSIGHIYVRHRDPDTAEYLFNLAHDREKNPNVLSNKYDSFPSFDTYWIYYCNADALFRDFYNKVGIKPRVFEASPQTLSFKEV